MKINRRYAVAASSGLALQETFYTNDGKVIDIVGFGSVSFAAFLVRRFRNEFGYESTFLYAPITQGDLVGLKNKTFTARDVITNAPDGLVLCKKTTQHDVTAPGIWSEIHIKDIPSNWLP